MYRNTLRNRCMYLAAFVALQIGHTYFFYGMPNNVGGMLLYHGSAALAEFFLIYLATELFSDELSFHIACLNLASMVCNFVGWILYIKFVPHQVYDTSMMVVMYVLVVRLFWRDSDVNNYLGLRVVLRDAARRHQFRAGKAAT